MDSPNLTGRQIFHGQDVPHLVIFLKPKLRIVYFNCYENTDYESMIIAN